MTEKNLNRRLTKNEKRRLKKKTLSEEGSAAVTANSQHEENNPALTTEIDYVAAEIDNDFGLDDQTYQHFRNVFEHFSKPEQLLSSVPRFTESTDLEVEHNRSKDEQSIVNAKEIVVNNKLSKKKKKLLTRLSVSELKQLVFRPDVVEAHDVTSSDPRLLIHLKSYRNTVSVPRHWCHVRKYLQGKRGIEKIPFQLPEFIAETGIAKIRETVLEQEALKRGKQKARERIRPKMGRIDIDYQVLHDAFFKYQTKPKMSGHGDLYFEGKEFEVQAREKKPGLLSDELVSALGMLDGAPPPWLINMQRYGPPPSYQNLKIPGLNAPLPPGAAYGYQPGGWGKPPVDDYGRPLYGDVFGLSLKSESESYAHVDRTFRWGQYELEEEYHEDSEAELESDNEDDVSKQSTFGNDDSAGLQTPSAMDGTSSIIMGLETPDTIDLRKRKGLETPDLSSDSHNDLYRVIQEKQTALTGQLFGSEKGYVVDKVEDIVVKDVDGTETAEKGKKRKAEQLLISRKVKEFKF